MAPQSREESNSLLSLFRILFPRMSHTNVVIRELRMLVCNLDLRHMTSRAIGFRRWTCLRLRLHRGLATTVAGQALGIVKAGDSIHRLVRIVASDATDPGIVANETFAQLKPVRLEPDEADTVCFEMHHRVESAMTLTAKTGNLFSIKTGQGLGNRFEISSCRIGPVLQCALVAATAREPGFRLRRNQPLSGGDTARMTSEAISRLP